jgi:hypothetical protein
MYTVTGEGGGPPPYGVKGSPAVKQKRATAKTQRGVGAKIWSKIGLLKVF